MTFNLNQRLKKHAFIIVAFWVATLGAFAGQGGLGSLSTKDLISKLADESNQGIGSDETAWFSGFMAMNDASVFQGGILGSEKPSTSPVMQELVRRGLKALPELLDHLTDARPSKFTVGAGSLGKWFSNEYDPRYKDPQKQPSGVNIENWGNGLTPEKNFTEYSLKVGDFCFIAVGQIVNRKLNAIRYQPSMCLVVNSPVETPSLAAAVRTDWSNLTREEHEQSLISDINRCGFYSPAEGLKRLWFYYPRTGEVWIVKMLDRPVYDKDLTINFFEKVLVAAQTIDKAVNLLKKFHVQHSEADYIGVLEWMVWNSNFTEEELGNDDQQRAEKLIAIKLLNRIFPSFDPFNPPFLNGVMFSDKKDLIEKLSTIHFPKKDTITFHFLQEILSKKTYRSPTEQENRSLDALALSKELSSVEKYKSVFHDTIYKLLSEYQGLSKAEADAKKKDYYIQWINYLQWLLK